MQKTDTVRAALASSRWLGVLLMVAASWACGEDPELIAARDQVAQLQSETDGLRQTLGEQTAGLEEYSKSLREIWSATEEIASRHDLLVKISGEMQSGELENGLKVDYRRTILATLSEIDQQMDRFRSMEGELRAKTVANSEARRLLDEMKIRVESSEREIGRMGRNLSAALEQIETQEAVIAEQGEAIEVLEEEIVNHRTVIDEHEDTIGRQQTELHQARKVFVGVFDAVQMKRLRELGVIHRQRGVWLPTEQSLKDGQIESYFMTMASTTDQLELSGPSRKQKVRSLHVRYPNLYRMWVSETATELEITDPEAFWRVADVLIVEVWK